ncbi:hypothetical protein Tco_0635360 [Tanacetum coccineum]
MLKGRSIWELNKEVSDSWVCKNILKFMHDARSHMVKHLGDGGSTSMRFDNLSSLGALNEFLSYRDLYNVRFNANMYVKDFVVKENGQWPVEWIEDFPKIIQLPNIVLDTNKADKLV